MGPVNLYATVVIKIQECALLIAISTQNDFIVVIHMNQ